MKCFMTGRECDYPADEISGAFMLSPFGYPFDDLYDHAIKPTFSRLGHKIDRADKTLQLGYVMCQRICRQIQGSEFVMADLTVPNANVYYELGLAYSLGKKILIIQNTQAPHSFQNLFSDVDTNDHAIISYTTMADLTNVEPLKQAIADPIQIEECKRLEANRAVFTETGDVLLINVENGMTPLAGLQGVTIKNAISRGVTASTWKVRTVRLSEKDTVITMVASIQDAKLCVADTTHYQGSTNMYVYLFLGLAHGFQKEVVPVINATLNRDVPFDIHGLWQIYFNRSEELETWLVDVLPRAQTSLGTQQRGYLYKQLWSPFMEARRSGRSRERKSLHVMTCARNVHDKDRGDRTNLDKNDFTTVADLSFFIGETFEHAKVQIEPPTSKRTIADLTITRGKKQVINKSAVDQLRREIFAEFNTLKGNWLIVGAPDSSDYSEVVLAHAHGIAPFRPEQSKEQLPFVFVKERSENNPLNISSFYEQPSNGREMIRWLGQQNFECREVEAGDEFRGVTRGVITILNKPALGDMVQESKKFMILSGFTGIATYAMLEILTDEKYKNEYTKLLEAYTGLQAQHKNVNILVTADYHYKQSQVSGENPGDSRELTSLRFEDIQEISTQTKSCPAQNRRTPKHRRSD